MSNWDVKWYINRGLTISYIESIGDEGRTPLLQAIRENRFSLVKELVEEGADIYAVDRDYNGVLFQACVADSPKLIRYLFENGADLNEINENGETPLMYALAHEKVASVQTLITLGADQELVDFEGRSVMEYAANKTLLCYLQHA